ncbi:hypothetical protein GF359_09905 [candidate division WOR-3 bacterium]|uniref:DUF2284 domain-containing protein n=1 Tax=candidate division WOR-3 bacterium TaxID=2052148 RepID=A0A9D5KB54_UNCW3|nr:hypothetical protein [candidate division WOR-3 bacterium]MBD3365514.1 hypothetical protein [candidate division WOR-3 bacterium]
MRAVDAVIVPAETVVVAQWVREKCRFGCPGYGKNLMCPPNTPTPFQTRKMIDSYKVALLIHGTEKTPINRIVEKLEKSMLLDGFEKSFGMGAGPCFLCEDCPDDASGCRYPDKARPSMEACGIDVYSTVRAHGFPIEVLKTMEDKPNYYGLILIE